MADQFDENGYNSGDFKRERISDAGQMDNNLQMEQDGEDMPKLNEKAGEYMRELLSEKIKLNTQKFPVSCKLIDQEVSKVQTTGRIPARDSKYLDVFREKPVKVTVKVLVPIKEHPKFNFVGKLLGPKGNTMKQMQEETMCKMAVLGRGSMKDRRKEEELRNSLDPKYAHLTDELHVEISALAPPAEAHARIAYALAEVKKYLIPDNMDMMRQTQMRDIMDRVYCPQPGRPAAAWAPAAPRAPRPRTPRRTRRTARCRPRPRSSASWTARAPPWSPRTAGTTTCTGCRPNRRWRVPCAARARPRRTSTTSGRSATTTRRRTTRRRRRASSRRPRATSARAARSRDTTRATSPTAATSRARQYVRAHTSHAQSGGLQKVIHISSNPVSTAAKTSRKP